MGPLQEIEQKIFGKRFAWDQIDKSQATKTPQVLDALREACLIESYFSAYMAQMLSLFWYDNKATAMFTIEAFEAYTHYYALRKYLDTIGYKPIDDQEIIELRKKDQGKPHTNELQELVNFGMTEFFAAYFFADLSELAEEPVLKTILSQFGKEEVIHAEFAFDLIADRLTSDHDKRLVLDYASHFQHIGSYVLPSVANAKTDNLEIIRKFNTRIEQLVGKRLSDHTYKER